MSAIRWEGLRGSHAFVLLIFLCFPNAFSASPTPPKDDPCVRILSALKSRPDPLPLLSRLVATELSMKNIRDHLEKLTGVKPIFVRYSLEDRYSESNKEWSRHLIIHHLQQLGHQVMLEDFGKGLNFYIDIQGTTQPDEVFEVTAHYDTVHKGVPGADDNGSGLGLLLELARIFTVHPPGRTLRITFMDLEEQDFQGSKAHAAALENEFGKKDRLFLGSIVLDTIGYNPKGSNDQRVVIEVGELSDFKGGFSFLGPSAKSEDSYRLTLQCAESACFQYLRFADAASKRGPLSLSVEKSTAAPTTADHGSFWDVKLPAVLIAAPYKKPYINPGYHTPKDTIENMNWEYYGRVSEFVVETLAHVTQAEPRFEDEAVLKDFVKLISQEENRAIAPGEHLVTQLETPKPPPRRYFSDSSSESSRNKDKVERGKKWLGERGGENLIVVLNRGLDEVDLVALEGDSSLWYQNTPDANEILTAGLAADAWIVRKTAPGIITYSDMNELRGWIRELKKAKEEKKALPLPPKDFERYIHKPAATEKKRKNKGKKEDSDGEEDTHRESDTYLD